jgi:hypothetical protein
VCSEDAQKKQTRIAVRECAGQFAKGWEQCEISTSTASRISHQTESCPALVEGGNGRNSNRSGFVSIAKTARNARPWLWSSCPQFQASCCEGGQRTEVLTLERCRIHQTTLSTGGARGSDNGLVVDVPRAWQRSAFFVHGDATGETMLWKGRRGREGLYVRYATAAYMKTPVPGNT